MKNDAQHMLAPRVQTAHAVPHIHPVQPAGSLYGPVMHRENTASPCASGTTSVRDCMRERCSVITNSPPLKSRAGADSSTAI